MFCEIVADREFAIVIARGGHDIIIEPLNPVVPANTLSPVKHPPNTTRPGHCAGLFRVRTSDRRWPVSGHAMREARATPRGTARKNPDPPPAHHRPEGPAGT